MVQAFFPWEQAQMGLQRHSSRLAKQGVQQACAERLAQSLDATDLSHLCSDIDKVFCSAWLDHNNVLVGTKCNKLRVVHLPTRTWHEVPYPEQPVHRQGPDLLAQANGSHCGQHDMAVSPSGTFLVSGATAAEDLLLWRLQDSSSLESSASSSGSGRQVMQPLQTFMGHADWVFGLDWITDRHWVSAGRDRTIKLWQVPDTAASEAAYTADPGSALLSVSYHQGKVRAISYGRQQQQVVALSTDNTISWWTADLQLKGSARLSSITEPATLATNGSTVAVGSVGQLHVLDTRAPNGGLQQPTSRDLQQQQTAAAGRRSRHPPFTGSLCLSARTAMLSGSLDAAAAAAQPLQSDELLLLLRRFLPVQWLPPAYHRGAPVRPVVLAVTDPLPGMQALQQTASCVGMDPCTAEQLLRREAATQAVAQGKPFDAALERLLGRLTQLPPRQQLQELKALQQKFPAEPRQPQSHQPQEPPLSDFQTVLEAARWLDARGLAGASRAILSFAPFIASGLSADRPALDGLRQLVRPAPALESEEEEEEEEGQYSDASDDEEEQFDDEYVDYASAADDGSPGVSGRGGILLRAAGSRAPQPQLQSQSQQGAAPTPPPAFKARVTSQLVLDDSVVRSVSIQNDYILGVGHNSSVEFYDMRRMQGQRINIHPGHAADGSSVRLRRLEMDTPNPGVDPFFLQQGFGAFANTQSTVYTHCWDPSGTRVLAAGGPLAWGCRGAFLQVLT